MTEYFVYPVPVPALREGIQGIQTQLFFKPILLKEAGQQLFAASTLQFDSVFLPDYYLPDMAIRVPLQLEDVDSEKVIEESMDSLNSVTTTPKKFIKSGKVLLEGQTLYIGLTLAVPEKK